MTSIRCLFRITLANLMCLLALACVMHPCHAEDATVPALMVSDIHFDPFHAPDRGEKLLHTPEQQWGTILAPASTVKEELSFAALQLKCRARGVDTPYPLLRASLHEMESTQRDARFMTVSGDLIAHDFSCRYQSLFPNSTPQEYQNFVVKTIRFVVEQLQASFPGIPIYFALGNNDTGCGDYRLDAGGTFLAQAGEVIASALPASQRRVAIKEFAEGGYYSVMMAAPMENTRLIVVNDLFESPNYVTCSGSPDPAPATAEMAWLKAQLEQARQHKQRVWVMGHIPPGVNPYSTIAKFKDVCGKDGPEMFLTSEKMADLLVEYADVMRLGIFAHTHMDEMRLLQPEGARPGGSLERSVVLKLVPSISPVDGNDPSFTVARVNPATALMQDYAVIAAPDRTGGGAWTREYDYAQAYHQAEYSPAALNQLISTLEDDRRGRSEASEQYMNDYFVGKKIPELKPFWPQYACSLANYTARGYSGCVCSQGK